MEELEALKFWDPTVKNCDTKLQVALLYIEGDGKREICLPLKHT